MSMNTFPLEVFDFGISLSGIVYNMPASKELAAKIR